MNRPDQSHFPVILAVGLLGFFGAGQFLPNAMIVWPIFAVVAFAFAREIDRGIPIELIGALLAAVQWLLGPLLSYRFGVEVDRYFMYVEEAEYFGFAIPTTSAFICGLLSFSGRCEEKELLRQRDGRQDFKIGMVLLIGAVASEFVRPFAPGGLSFFFHLIAQLRYIAAVYFLLSHHRYKWILVFVSLSQLLIRSSEQAMFHDLILWGTLIGCYWWLLKKRTTMNKMVFLSSGILFVSVIQTVKQDYRKAAWSGENPSLVAAIYELVIVEGRFGDRSTLENAIVRMNQGWIVSAVLRHTPAREPFANGETIWDAVVAATMPRFLAPDKKKAGGQENFRRFTGLALADSTSMGISPLGEAYANYGKGGWFFMLIWGSTFGFGIGLFRRTGRKDANFLIWSPLIFYQAIKAETEIVVVLNQLVKGSVVAFACYYAIHRVWIKNAGIFVPGRIDDAPQSPLGSLADIQRH